MTYHAASLISPSRSFLQKAVQAAFAGLHVNATRPVQVQAQHYLVLQVKSEKYLLLRSPADGYWHPCLPQQPSFHSNDLDSKQAV